MKPPVSQRIKQLLPICALILVNLLVGVLVLRDYGESWDESGIYTYAQASLASYSNLYEHNALPKNLNVTFNAENYGPAYAMITTLLAQRLTAVIPAWSTIDGWHFGEFLAFQISVLSLYFLCRKWMGGWAAFGATLLYSTQPVLWGHAFINPKDIPFLGFFLASVTVGIYMVDALPASLNQGTLFESPGNSNLLWRDEWRRLPSLLRAITVSGGVIFLDSLLFIAAGGLRRLASDAVVIFYEADKTSLLGSIFSQLARNSSHFPVGDYVSKAQILLLRAETAYVRAGFGIGLLIFLAISSRYLWNLLSRRVFPFLKRTAPLFINPAVLAAAIVLGFTTSIRVAGPYAGLMVLAYAFYKSWRKAILLVLPYTVIALLACYLSWPYLWSNPVSGFFSSVTLMAHYPWTGEVLFQGQILPPSNLPGYFLPYLMSIQLTEVVPILFLIGLLASARYLIKGRQVEPFAITLLWFLLPLLGIILDKSQVYDNFRQELFLIPPLFVCAGVAFEVLFSKVKKELFRVLLLAAVVFPGLYADVTLHPYQYAYYNTFVGGEAGAFRKFELDYWATSYREAALYVNQVAPTDATVIVEYPSWLFQAYARPDLNVTSLDNPKPGAHYDFIVLNTRTNGDMAICPSIRATRTIARDGAILAIIKALPPSVKGCP
ncbi:MAG: hypothetical protein ABSG98_00925 [Anaerolineales bacterium]|jgi:hypothetical protein